MKATCHKTSVPTGSDLRELLTCESQIAGGRTAPPGAEATQFPVNDLASMSNDHVSQIKHGANGPTADADTTGTYGADVTAAPAGLAAFRFALQGSSGMEGGGS